MEYLFLCLQNLPDHQVVTATKSVNNLWLTSFAIAIIYLASWNRSKLYALAYFFIEIVTKMEFFGLYMSHYNYKVYSIPYLSPFYLSDVMHHYSVMILTAILFTIIFFISKTNSKFQRVICVMIVTFELVMTFCFMVGGSAALYLYDNYENIVFCLHVMLILSLYKPKPILRAMEDKFRDFLRAVDSIIFMRAFWYTKEISKQEFKLT